MTTTKVKDPMLDNLVWSDFEYRLFEFVDRFPLPQIVKVQEGYYGPTEDSCIGAEQVLTLHSVKTTEKVLARDRKKKELHIPLNCSQKVELRPADFRGIYETVEEISRIPTRFVRVTQGYYLEEEAVSVNPGDKLEVVRVEHGIGGKEDCVLFRTEERNPIRLPFSVSAGFQTLLDGREYYLKELMTSALKLPVYFQFIDPPSITRRSGENVFNTSLGVLSLEKVYQDSTVICSTKEGNVRTVVNCPKHLPVTINVARGALSDDKDYVRICRFFHDGVSLLKIENMELQNIYASRDTIREYEYVIDESTTPPPPVPPRDSSSGGSSSQVSEAGGNDSQDSDEDKHEYLYIDEPEIVKPKTSQEPKKDSAAALPPGDSTQAQDKNSNKTIPNENDDIYLEIESGPPQTPTEGSDTTPIQKPVKPPRKVKVESKKSMDESKPEAKSTPPPIKPKPPSIKKKPSIQRDKETFVVPDDLSQMSISEVSQFLRHFHFDSYVELFADNDVDGDLLVSLNEEELQALGMNIFECKKIFRLVGGWRPKI
ncbi:hypothetical protein ACROYT_G009132 [Oculina patagonica]